MRFVYFTHSLVSDWNHGNAHFLRGVLRELQRRGHQTKVFEPANGWSRANLVANHGEEALARFPERFPGLGSTSYTADGFALEAAMDGADVVIVHEWNEPWLVAALGNHRRRGGRYLLLFHDTHHRAASAPDELDRFDLSGYDGVLAFGEAIREIYLRRGWVGQAWTWHEAADTALFRPHTEIAREGDLIWIGNWGDGERTAELQRFLLAPVRALGLRARVHGVRYPDEALKALRRAGIDHGGWLANDLVPEAFARYRLTVHVPRGPYARMLPGIPTIRMFEALACGIPLVSAPWEDSEGLFRPGRDFLYARDDAAMTDALRGLLADPDAAADLAASGLETIRARHTCAHRVDELLAICARCGKAAVTADAAA
ncbi:MAG: glycosyltransferase [Rhodospirillales bacterium]|jgi:spore maturation protein CgeB|nr:glycosyltransferase [Rhodospirillales bacterium]